MSRKCEVCNKTFSNKGSLVRHKRTHTGEKPYECNVCNKRFLLSGDLAKHNRTHTGEKPYECDICNKRFSSSSQLAVHKRTHTGEKPYECDVCNKRFLQSGNLAVHKRTHTGDKPYECNVCNKRFAQLSNLATHKRTHTKSQPYECDICKKRFSESYKLTRHKITAHKCDWSFECDICQKKIVRQSLKWHRRTHLRDGLLFCNSCGKEIIQGRGHANEISSDGHFDCEKCNKQFPDIEGLNHHKAKDHGTSYRCDICKELESREATGIGYICCVCDVEFEIATELEHHMTMHDDVLLH